MTLWEILNLGRRIPYEHLSDREIVNRLKSLGGDEISRFRSSEDDDEDNEDDEDDEYLDNNEFERLSRPATSSKDIYDLMLECWRRDELQRPSFREISMFLQRKNLGYAPTS